MFIVEHIVHRLVCALEAGKAGGKVRPLNFTHPRRPAAPPFHLHLEVLEAQLPKHNPLVHLHEGECKLGHHLYQIPTH